MTCRYWKSPVGISRPSALRVLGGLKTGTRWLLATLMCTLIAISVAAPDFDKLQSLAQQRFGAPAADSVAAWRKLMEDVKGLSDTDKLNKVNTFFNRRVLYKTDQEGYNQEDYWATPVEFMGRGFGDCEDFAISKYMTLINLGIKTENLRLVYVRLKNGTAPPIAHMVLGYYAQPTEEPVILDNMVSSIRPASMRPDLSPVFSFNSEGLWAGAATSSSGDPTARLSRWRDVLDRMKQDGL